MPQKVIIITDPGCASARVRAGWGGGAGAVWAGVSRGAGG